jgi:transporter family-2 protein
MKAAWIFPFIITGGVLQTFGAAMNGALNKSLVNPFLASTVSFAVITVFFLCLSVMFPTPLPSMQNLAAMPWWAPLGGLVGAVQVYAGLTLVNKVGAGPFVGFTITAALVASLVVDHFGLLHMPAHPVNVWRVLGAGLMVGGLH